MSNDSEGLHDSRASQCRVLTYADVNRHSVCYPSGSFRYLAALVMYHRTPSSLVEVPPHHLTHSL